MTGFDEFVRAAQEFQNRADEEIIRSLLGQWVSELEPAVCRNREGRVIGLCVANTEVGDRPFILTVEAMR